MADHDQRMKVAVCEFLPEFVGLIRPTWEARYVFAKSEWLPQELFPDPPQGERRLIDLVARVPVLQPVRDSRQSHIHVEVESGDSVAEFRERMPRYHDFLGYRHDLPVLSLALYLGVALDGRGWDQATESFWEENLGSTRWPYLGLPGLDGMIYVESNNLLGVALSVLMRVPEDRQAWLKARALQRVAQAELTPYRRFLLMELIEAYLPLIGPHLAQYERLMQTEEFKMVRVLGKTTFEKGIEQGLEQGQRALLVWLLERRFGSLSPSIRARVEALPEDRVKQLADKLFSVNSLRELGLEDSNGSAPPAA